MDKWISSSESVFVPIYKTTHSNTFEFDTDNLKEEQFVVYNNKKDINMSEILKLLNELSSDNPQLSKEITQVETNSLKIMVERNNKQKYKEAYALAGIQGVLFQVLHKAERLKSQLLNDDKNFKYSDKHMVGLSLDDDCNWKDDFIHGNLVDLRNYCTLALGLFERYKNGNASKSIITKGRH